MIDDKRYAFAHSPRSMNTALSTHSRHNVPRSVRSCQRLRPARLGHDLLDATLLRSRLNWLLPRQVTYWLPLSVRISSGLP